MRWYENIKQLRKERGWNQSELARRVGYSDKSMISKIEKGAVDLPRSQILKFAHIFQVTPSEVMGDVDADRKALDAAAERRLLEYSRLLNDKGIEKLFERAEELRQMGYVKEGEQNDD